METAERTGKQGRRLQLALLAVVACFGFAVRFSTLEQMELNGDALIKWYFAKTWFLGNRYEVWNHHMARLGLSIPAFVTQKLFGTHPTVYSVAPLVCATLGVVYTYRLGALLGGPIAGVLAALIITELDEMVRAGSQLLPDGFMATYVVMAAFYAIKAGEESGRRRDLLLTVAAVLTFGAYLSKISSLFFLPGLGLAVWRGTKAWRGLLVFFGVLLALYLCEHIAYMSLTNYPLGRLQIVLGSHTTFQGSPTTDAVEHVAASGQSWHIFLFPFPFVAAGLFALTGEVRARDLVWLVVGYYFGQAISGSRALARYLTPMAPIIAVAYGVFVAKLMAPEQSDGLPWTRRIVRLMRRRPEIVCVVLLVAFAYRTSMEPNVGHEVMARTRHQTALATNAYAQGVPIVHIAQRNGIMRRTMAMLAIPYAYLPDDTLLPRNQRVKIPRTISRERLEKQWFQTLEVRHRTYVSMTKDPIPVPTLERLIADKCTLLIRHVNGFLHFDREQPDAACTLPGGT